MNKCLNCGQPVKNKYCNTTCQNKHQKVGLKLKPESIKKRSESVKNKWKIFKVHCHKCNKEFEIKEFDTISPKKEYYYCSRSCANSRKQKNETKNKISDSLIKNKFGKFFIDNLDVNLQKNILNLRNDKLTYDEIYIRIDKKITKENVRLLCNKNGLSYVNRLDDSEKDNIRKLYKEFENIKKIARITGYTKDTIRKYIIIPSKLTDSEKKKNSSKSVVNWRKDKKRKLIEYKGGKCEVCGYDKCMRSLDFHHLDPNEKEFAIGSGDCKCWDKIKIELDKCILVCKNCHGEIHYDIEKNKVH